MAEETNDWLSVPQMATEVGVSQDKVRTWCRTGRVAAMNIGDAARSFYRVRRDEWERFKQRRLQRSVTPRPLARRGTNLLGI